MVAIMKEWNIITCLLRKIKLLHHHFQELFLSSGTTRLTWLSTQKISPKGWFLFPWSPSIDNINMYGIRQSCSDTPLLIVDKGEGNLGHLAQTFSLSRCGGVHNLFMTLSSFFVVFSDRFLRMGHLIHTIQTAYGHSWVNNTHTNNNKKSLIFPSPEPWSVRISFSGRWQVIPSDIRPLK